MHNAKAFWTLAVFLLTVCNTGLAQSAQPSLGDLARQNKAHKKAAKVLTEDDLPSIPTTGVSVVGPAAKEVPVNAASPTKPVAGVPGKAPAVGNGPAPVNELKKALSSSEEQISGWKRSAQRYEELLANETDGFRRQMYQDALENDRKNVALYQKKADQLKDEVAAAEKASGQGSSGQTSQNTASGK